IVAHFNTDVEWIGDAYVNNAAGLIESSGTLGVSGHNYGTIKASAVLFNFGIENAGVLNSSSIMVSFDPLVNSGILNVNSGKFESDAAFTNSGIVDNYGNFISTDQFHNSGIINNYGTFNPHYQTNNENGGTISNYGTIIIMKYTFIKNQGSIFNYNIFRIWNLENTGGTLENRGALINLDDINNVNGTFTNYCNSKFINKGIVDGSPPHNIACNYSLSLNPSSLPSGSVSIHLGQDITASAHTKSQAATKVEFKWVDPTGSTIRDDIVPLSGGSAKDQFTPYEAGVWTVYA